MLSRTAHLNLVDGAGNYIALPEKLTLKTEIPGGTTVVLRKSNH